MDNLICQYIYIHITIFKFPDYVASSTATSRNGMLEGDVYAQVVKPNIACENGVVHIIDNVLGYIYRSIPEMISTNKNML